MCCVIALKVVVEKNRGQLVKSNNEKEANPFQMEKIAHLLKAAPVTD